MPYDQSSKVVYDLWGDNKGNQAQPLLLSNKGRYIWSEHPIKYEFNNGLITVSTRQGKIDSGRSGSNCGCFRICIKKIFSIQWSYSRSIALHTSAIQYVD